MAEAVDACAGVSLLPLDPADCVEVLDAVIAAERQLTGLKLRLVRRIDAAEVGPKAGATLTAVWLRGRYRLGIGTGPYAGWVGPGGVDRPAGAAARGSAGCAAPGAGRIDHRHAGPYSAGRPARGRQRLVEEAGRWDAGVLARLGAVIVAGVAAERVDAEGIEAMERAERREQRDRYLSIRPGRDGSGYRVDGRLTTEQAAVVNAALDPLCKPQAADDRTPGQRRADALEDVCKLALNTTDLPDNGGDRPQVVVTTHLDTLTGQLGAGTLDTGEQLSPATVRRLCCDAMLLPAVLGTTGQLPDLRRERRLFTGPLRRALVLRDGGCAFPSCDRPPRWCVGHHVTPWHQGGATCLANAVLLCGFHHRAIHQPGGWTVFITADGCRPSFHRCGWTGAETQRNHYPRRQ